MIYFLLKWRNHVIRKKNIRIANIKFANIKFANICEFAIREKFDNNHVKEILESRRM